MSSVMEKRVTYEEHAKIEQIKYYSGGYHHVKRREVMQKIVRSVLTSYHSTALDVGCGDGWYTYPLSTIVSNVIGIDISVKRLRRACSYVRKASFVLCDVNHLPFKDKAFDLVVAAQFLEHMEEPKNAIGKLVQCVNDKGLLFFEVPSRSNLIDQMIITIRKQRPMWGLTIDPTHKQFFDENELINLFGMLHLRIVKVVGVVHLRYRLRYISRMVWDSKKRFWKILDILEALLGLIKSRWGAIQAFIVKV